MVMKADYLLLLQGIHLFFIINLRSTSIIMIKDPSKMSPLIGKIYWQAFKVFQLNGTSSHKLGQTSRAVHCLFIHLHLFISSGCHQSVQCDIHSVQCLPRLPDLKSRPHSSPPISQPAALSYQTMSKTRKQMTNCAYQETPPAAQEPAIFQCLLKVLWSA